MTAAATTREQVTVTLSGVPFTGWLVDKYATERDDIVLVVQPVSYVLQGKTFTVDFDGSVFRVSADALVEG